MKTYETSVTLSLRPDGDQIILVVRTRIPQFAGKKLIEPSGHVFENDDPSKIKYIFQVDTAADPATFPTTHIISNFEVEIGQCSRPSDDAEKRTLGSCAEAQDGQPNAILSKYDVIVEIDDGRKSITSISEDADIDLVRLASAEFEQEPEQTA